MTRTDRGDATPETVTISLTPETRDQRLWLSRHREVEIDELARELFSEELEAQVCLARSPNLRKNIYR